MKFKKSFLAIVIPFSLLACGGGGGNSSESASSVSTVAKPIFSIASGTYLKGEVLFVTPETTGTRVHITTDGSDPRTSGGLIVTARTSFTLNNNITINAIAEVDGDNSELVSETYIVVTDANSSLEAPLLASRGVDYNEGFAVDDFDYFNINMSENSTYIVDICDSDLDGMDSHMELFSDQPLSTHIAIDAFEGTPFDTSLSQLVYKNTSDGLRYIFAKDEGGSVIDSYNIRFYIPQQFASLISTYELTGALVGYESSLYECARRFYKFNATAGTPYTIFTYLESGDVDTALVLYNKDFDGVEAMNNDSTVGGLATCAHCSAIEFTPTESGTYYFMVKGANDTQTDTYEVYVGY